MTFWKNYMHRRERWYHQLDNNRLVRPFEWGLEYIVDHVNGDDPRELFRSHTDSVMQASEDFYALPPTPLALGSSRLKTRTERDHAMRLLCCRSGTRNLKATLKRVASST